MPDSIVLERLFTPANRQQPVSVLKRQRVYIFPSREGFILMIALIAMLLGAINYNNNMAYILTFMLGSIFMISMLYTWRNLAGLIITGSSPRAVFAGETASFPLVINNYEGQSRPAINLVSCPDVDKKTKVNVNQSHVLTDIPADHWHQVAIRIPAKKRGLLPLGRVKISTKYPLGLFNAWSYIELKEKCVVYPKPDGNKQLPEPYSADAPGQSGIKAGTDDFAGFRHYHAGDSIRNIAWKALAREQDLLVKRFSGDGIRILILRWNDLSFLPNIEARLSQLSMWVLQAEHAGVSYGLEIPRVYIEPDHGMSHKNNCLEALAYFDIDRD